jgi:hypothetical protein
MAKEEALKNIKDSIIARIKNKEQVEDNRIELKREWYKFKDPTLGRNEESEFLKDIVAIANTPGPEGYLIIGIDEKSGEVYDSPFSKSGFKNFEDLSYFVVKNVDLPFKFDINEIEHIEEDTKKIISFLTIPPSLDKPHVIKLFKSEKQEIQNYIPVRKGNCVWPASRSDIEFMYWDRKNIEPEYELDFLIYKSSWDIGDAERKKIIVSLPIAFRNYGRKPIAITNSTLKIILNDIKDNPTELVCDLDFYSLKIGDIPNDCLKEKPIIIPSNQIVVCDCYFYYNDFSKDLKDRLSKMNNFSYNITAEDVLGNKYTSKVFQKI